MKIYTKTGDKGQTSLLGGLRVEKNDPRVEAYGNLDELNSWIGLLRDQEIPHHPQYSFEPEILKNIQETIFVIGSYLASDPESSAKYLPSIPFEQLALLEINIDFMESKLSPLKNFILPGGHISVSFVHIARNVCRRAERGLVGLKEISDYDPFFLIFLNRLSDYLFVLSRYWTEILGVPEYKWIPNPRT